MDGIAPHEAAKSNLPPRPCPSGTTITHISNVYCFELNSPHSFSQQKADGHARTHSGVESRVESEVASNAFLFLNEILTAAGLSCISLRFLLQRRHFVRWMISRGCMIRGGTF